jgi:hypothetical protein
VCVREGERESEEEGEEEEEEEGDREGVSERVESEWEYFKYVVLPESGGCLRIPASFQCSVQLCDASICSIPASLRRDHAHGGAPCQ